MNATLRMRVAMALVAGLAWCASARADLILTAATEEANDNSIAGTNGPVTAKVATNSHFFDFRDKNGDGVFDDPIVGGLNLNGKILSYNWLSTVPDNPVDHAGYVFKLDLNGGPIFNGGSIINYGDGSKSTGYINIINAGAITLTQLSTSKSNKGWAGGISVVHTGDFTATSVTANVVNSQSYSGGIKLYGNGGGAGTSGALRIDTLQAADLTSSGYGVDIQHYNSVNITTLLQATRFFLGPAPGDVQIINIGSGGVTLPTVDVSSTSNLNSNTETSDVTISTTGPVTINGDLTFFATGLSGGSGGKNAGDVTITAGAKLWVKGTINGDCDYGNTFDGYLDLTTTATGSDPTIVIGSSGVAKTLDLAKVQYVRFAASNHASLIYQTVSGFTGNGSTQLRVGAANDVVYYFDFNGFNATLRAGGTDGVYTIGDSGILKPYSQANTPTNNSKLWIGTAQPTASLQTTSGAQAFGKVLLNSVQSDTLNLHSYGYHASDTNASVTLTGAAMSSNAPTLVNFGTVSAINVGLNTSVAGEYTGTGSAITIDNLATNSSDTSQGSDNGNAYIYVTGIVGWAKAAPAGSDFDSGEALSAYVANSTSLAGLASVVHDFVGNADYTSAKLLAGTTTSDGAQTAQMNWRQHTATEYSDSQVISDVVDLTLDVSKLADTTYVLQMTYDPSTIPTGKTEADLALLYSADGLTWANAGTGSNLGAWTSSDTTPGQWGVDTATNVVWAVLNHNSQFAIGTVVPEPATMGFLALGGLAMAGAAIRRRWRGRT
ncbi:MAG: PEP-CTERM sorting domain-containing protein [Phycisphaerae bacterium]|nr:PEP-CTERM sorting domain-containing protein [Phycisphaerae bacterium]